MDRNEERQAHLIYGYRERAGKNRWYIGCTMVRNKKNRRRAHRWAKEEGSKFHRFIRKSYRDGKSFDDVLEYFELETFFGTDRNASLREDKYTEIYDALAPNGFVLSAGRYAGKKSEEFRKRCSDTAKRTWACPDRRKAQSIRCSGWKQTAKAKERISKTQRNFSPEKKAKKKADTRATRAITKKRKQEAERKEEMIAKLTDAKARLKSGWKPKMKGHDLAAFIVIKANRAMTEKEVEPEIRKHGFKGRVVTFLKRASGFDLRSTLKYTGNKEYERLEMFNLPSGRFAFRPRPEFTSWMIPE